MFPQLENAYCPVSKIFGNFFVEIYFVYCKYCTYCHCISLHLHMEKAENSGLSSYTFNFLLKFVTILFASVE